MATEFVTYGGRKYPVTTVPPYPGTWLRNGLFGLNVRFVDIRKMLKDAGRERNRDRNPGMVHMYVVHVTASYSTLQGFVNYIVRNFAGGGSPTIPVCLNCYDDVDGYIQFLPLEQTGAASVAAEPFSMSVETVNKGDANADTWVQRQKDDHAKAFAQGVALGWWPLQVSQTSTPNFSNGGIGFHSFRGNSHKSNCTNGTSDMTLTCGKTCPGNFHRGYTGDRRLFKWNRNGLASDAEGGLLGTMRYIYATAATLLAPPPPPTPPVGTITPKDDDMADYAWKNPGLANAFLMPSVTPVTEKALTALMKGGLQLIEEAHLQTVVSASVRNGMREIDWVVQRADLVGDARINSYISSLP